MIAYWLLDGEVVAGEIGPFGEVPLRVAAARMRKIAAHLKAQVSPVQCDRLDPLEALAIREAKRSG